MNDQQQNQERAWTYRAPADVGSAEYTDRSRARAALNNLAPELAEAVLAFCDSRCDTCRNGGECRSSLCALADKLRQIGGAS